MKQHLLLGTLVFLFILNEFYLKNKITSFFKKFTKFSNAVILLISICSAFIAYKNNPDVMQSIINPYIKKNYNIDFIEKMFNNENSENNNLNKNSNNNSNNSLNNNSSNLNNNSNNYLNNNSNNNLNNNLNNNSNNLDNNLNNNLNDVNNYNESKHKRSVSETKKKFVAANQHWKCKNCNSELDASFEVHHVLPLYLGGSNDTDNLSALCRNCHGKETVKDKVSN